MAMNNYAIAVIREN
jgi:hypothetical protein